MFKKILLIIAALICMAAAPAYAEIEECTINYEQNSVAVKGTAEADSQLLLTVVRKEPAEEDFFENVAYQDQQETGSDGQFSFEFKMNVSGLYTVYASTPDNTYTYDFVFADNDSVNSLIQSINSAQSESEIYTLISENRYVAGLYLTGIDQEPDYSYIAGLIMDSKPYDTSTADETIKLFEQYMLYGYLKDSRIENIFAYSSYLDISSIDNIEFFTDDIFKTSHQIEATKRISGKSFRNHEEFSDALTEQMSLALIMDPNGYGNIEKVCELFEDRIGIDTSKADSSVYRSMYGKSFDDFADLKEFFDDACKQTSGGTGGGGTGSGSGGSTSGGGGNGPSSGGIITGGSNTGLEQVPIDTTETVDTVFTDLDGYDWAVESIAALYDLGVISGRTEELYVPADSITRSEFVKLVVLAFDIDDGTGRLPFEDTDESSWDYQYIKAAYEAGIINGISSTEFGGNLTITRQDMAVMLCRAADTAPADDASVKRFVDDGDIKDYAYNDVYALRSAGVINGDDTNRFHPNDPATRAEAAKMVYAAMQ